MTDKMDAAGLASMIDHTLLKPEATPEAVQQLCAEARTYGFAGVCVHGAHIRLVARELADTAVMPVAVVGFPSGACTGRVKAFEAREAVRHGAKELDMVLNVGALKSADFRRVYDDIHIVVAADRGVPVKVILETVKLTDEEKRIGCALAQAAGAKFVKTSTGFGGGGATEADVALMRSVVGPGVGVKASGGIRDRATAVRMIQAGANRIGASASVAIVTE